MCYKFYRMSPQNTFYRFRNVQNDTTEHVLYMSKVPSCRPHQSSLVQFQSLVLLRTVVKFRCVDALVYFSLFQFILVYFSLFQFILVQFQRLLEFSFAQNLCQVPLRRCLTSRCNPSTHVSAFFVFFSCTSIHLFTAPKKAAAIHPCTSVCFFQIFLCTSVHLFVMAAGRCTLSTHVSVFFFFGFLRFFFPAY